VLLVDDGLTRRKVADVLYASAIEIETCLTRFREGGVEGLLDG